MIELRQQRCDGSPIVSRKMKSGKGAMPAALMTWGSASCLHEASSRNVSNFEHKKTINYLDM
jgi:hypothetical protein